MGAMSELHIKMQDELMNTIHLCEEGELTVLDAYISLEEQRRHLENTLAIVKSFKDDFFNEITYEAQEQKDGYRGYLFEIRNGGKTYNFKNIPEWQDAEKNKKEVEERYKAMLNAKLKGSSFANISEDGEELPLPEITYRKSSIILKAKKG